MKRLAIIAMIVILAAAGGIASGYNLDKSTTKPSRHYDKSTLERIAGVELSENNRDLEDIPCMYYSTWKVDDDNPLRYITFYVFDDEASANYVFARYGRKWFQDGSEYGEDYVRGWLEGVCDAEIESYLYISGNMIVSSELQCISCWAEPVDEDIPPVTYEVPKRPTPEEIIDYIRSNY